MRKLYERVRAAEAFVAAALLVAMVVLIFLGDVMRMLGHPINWSGDTATCFFAWGCFLCADIAWRKNALMLWAALAVTVAITAKKRGIAAERRHAPSLREVASALRGGVWAVLFPVFLLAGLRMGVFTPSEVGAFAVVYAIAIGVFAYRQLDIRSVRAAIEGSLADVGAVMFLIALSAIFAYGIVFDRVPEVIPDALLGVTDNRHGIMVLIVAFLLIAGCFIDGSVLIIMLTPIFLPLIRDLDGDPVHFGLVFIVAVTIGNFTPPVGSAMYAVCSILKCPIGAYSRESVPFLVAVGLVTLLLVFVPDVVLFVPDLIFGKDGR